MLVFTPKRDKYIVSQCSADELLELKRFLWEKGYVCDTLPFEFPERFIYELREDPDFQFIITEVT